MSVSSQEVSNKRNALSEDRENDAGSSSKRPRRDPPLDDARSRWKERDSGKGKGKGKEKPIVGNDRPLRRRLNRRTKDTVSTSDVPSTSVSVSPPESAPTLVPSDHEEEHVTTPEERVNSPLLGPASASDAGSARDAASELARLQKELKAKNDLIQKHQDTFAALQGTLSCQICLEIMWDPYITTCGHTACLSCLQAWFKAPPPSPEQPEHVPLAPHLRKKNCPTCRSPVHSRPTPVFLVKSIISTARLYLDPTAAGEDHNRAIAIVPGGGSGAADPWAGIFPPAHHHQFGNAHAHGVIEDEEDRVMRCVDCFYEIFDGMCQGCGRVFDDLAHDGGYTDDDDDAGFPDAIAMYGFPHHHHPFDEEEEDEENEGEMDDFIDRDDEHNEDRHGIHHALGNLFNRHMGVHWDDPVPNVEDEDDNDDDIRSDHSFEPQPSRRFRDNPLNRRHIVISSDEEDDDAEEGGEIDEITEQRFRDIQARERERDMYGDREVFLERGAIERPGSSRRLISGVTIISDSESDENSDVEPDPPSHAEYPIVDDVVDEDDEYRGSDGGWPASDFPGHQARYSDDEDGAGLSEQDYAGDGAEYDDVYGSGDEGGYGGGEDEDLEELYY